MKMRFAVLLISFVLGSCRNNRIASENLADCPHPVPIAIFSDTLPAVTRHQFNLNAMESVEEVTFRNGVELTLIQSGCEARKQEFRFRLPGENFPANDQAFWREQITQQLRFLANLGPQYLALNAWTEAIEQLEGQIMLGEAIEIQPGFYIEIDRIISSDYAILLLILAERS